MHYRKHAPVLIFLLAILALFANLQGQYSPLNEHDLGDPRFEVDLAAFRSDIDNEVRLELYYKIYNDGLKFFKKKDNFVANYELNVVILGEDNKQLTGSSVERFYRLNDYRSTRNPHDFLINMINLSVGKGKFKAVCKLIDKNSNKIASIEKEFEVNSLFKGDIDISDLEYFREVIDADSIPSRFDKGEKRIIPIVSRVFGNEISQISFYTELYNTKGETKDVRMEFKVKDARDNEVYSDDNDLVLELPLTRYIKHIQLDEFVPGKYFITVDLTERSGKPLASIQSYFEVAWSLQAMIRNDYELALEQLKFVARKNDIDKLKDVPVEEREQAFTDFWKSKDPTPNTPENELMEKYYGRINHANRVFSSILKEGWKTDMGMVYIIYGEPDHIEMHPFELSEKPYQVWYYYSLSRTFGFVDEIGTGEYRLQFPYDGRRGFINDRIDDYE